MVVVRAGKSFPEQEASDADAEHIGQLVEVRRKSDWCYTVDEHCGCFTAQTVPTFVSTEITSPPKTAFQRVHFWQS